MLKLFPYQIEGVKALLSNKRWGLFDEQGLGKSIQAWVAARKLEKILKRRLKILILCPAHLILNWKREQKVWWPDKVPGTGKIRSFNYLQAHPELLAEHWDLVIVDEAQALKSWSAKQTKNFHKHIFPHAERLWLLTGTPATQSGADYHSILSFLQPGKWGKFGAFAERFSTVTTRRVKIWTKGKKPKRITIEIKQYKGFRNTAILNAGLRTCSTRRLKADVLPELPEKLYGELFVDVGPGDYEFVEGGDMQSCSPLAALGALKAEAAGDWIRFTQADGQVQPILLFTWFTQTCLVLETMLKKAGIRYRRITGRETRSEKESAVDDFQAGKIDVLICQTKAAGTGWNLQRAQTILVLDVPWSWADFAQISDRANRIGSKNPVRIITCVAEGTPDDNVLATMYSKRDGMEKCLDRKRDVRGEIQDKIMREISGGKHGVKRSDDKNGYTVVDIDL